MVVNIFGNGFVGKNFINNTKFDTITNDRNDLLPKACDQILYLISTIDNYSVKVNPYLDIETNLTLLIRVLENFRKNTPESIFNFASSWFVYGETDLPAKEDSYCNPKGFYSITKKCAEDLLISYCNTYNLKYRILRFANVLGLNDNKVSKKKNALTYMIKCIQNSEPINLYYKGDFFRDYINVKDLSNAIDIILENGEVNAIYNIANGEAIRFIDMINYAIRKTKSSSIVSNIDEVEFHKLVQVKSMYMDNTKLKNLGYSPKFSIFQTIEEILNDK